MRTAPLSKRFNFESILPRGGEVVNGFRLKKVIFVKSVQKYGKKRTKSVYSMGVAAAVTRESKMSHICSFDGCHICRDQMIVKVNHHVFTGQLALEEGNLNVRDRLSRIDGLACRGAGCLACEDRG